MNDRRPILYLLISAAIIGLIIFNLDRPSQIVNINIVQIPLQLVPKKCEKLFENLYEIHSTVGKRSPHELKFLVDSQSELPVQHEWVMDQEFSEISKSPTMNTITSKQIDQLIERIINKNEYNSYGDFNLEKVLREDLGKDLRSANIGVFGLFESDYSPWIESLLYLISNSTARITLIDHQRRSYENQANFKWENAILYWSPGSFKNTNSFDIVIDYMIAEKFGLGRYGEEIWIDADLAQVELAECVVKPGGLLILGVTLAKEIDQLKGEGYIINNAGRVYGERRLKKITRGWTIRAERDFDFGRIRVFVLQKNLD